jgi:two-component system OmpR family response regulator
MATTNLTIPVSEPRPTKMDRILVIADDGALRKVLCRIFSSVGYEVDVVPANLVDLDIFCQTPPSAVIIDLPHAESLRGDLCRKIANLIPGLPILILSASSDVADKFRPLEMAAGDYLSIPFSPWDLVDRLRTLMRRSVVKRSHGNLQSAELGSR